MPYKMRVFNKIVANFLLADYNELLCDITLEGVIQMIAHVKTIEETSKTRLPNNVELWQKL